MAIAGATLQEVKAKYASQSTTPMSGGGIKSTPVSGKVFTPANQNASDFKLPENLKSSTGMSGGKYFSGNILQKGLDIISTVPYAYTGFMEAFIINPYSLLFIFGASDSSNEQDVLVLDVRHQKTFKIFFLFTFVIMTRVI